MQDARAALPRRRGSGSRRRAARDLLAACLLPVLMATAGTMPARSPASAQSVPPSVAGDANGLTEQARSLHRAGRYAEAEPLYRSALALKERALGPEHPEVGTALNDLGALYEAQGRYAEAEPILRRALAIAEKAFGPQHPGIATGLNNLAALFEAQGRYGEAEPLYRRALAIGEKALGPEHPTVGAFANNLAALYEAQGRYADAEPFYRRALAIAEKTLGLEHPEVATYLANLAALYRLQGRYAEAEPLLRRALAIGEKTLGSEHPDLGVPLNNLAALYRAQGHDAEAEPLYRRALAIRERALGPEHPDVGAHLGNLAGLLQAAGRYDEAEPLLRRALAIRENTLGPEHPDVAAGLNNLATLAQMRGRSAEAEPLYRRSVAIGEKVLGPEHPDVGSYVHNLASLYSTLGRADAALPLVRRTTAIGRRRSAGTSAAVASEQGLLRDKYLLHVAVAAVLAESRPVDAPALSAEAFEVAQLAGRSGVGSVLARTASRFAAGSDALARAVRDRQDAEQRLERVDRQIVAASAKPPQERSPGAEAALRTEGEAVRAYLAQVDAALARDFPAYAELASVRPLALADAQALLAGDEALVTYAVGEAESHLWVLRRDRAALFRLAVTRQGLATEIAALRLRLDPGVNARLLPFDAGRAYALHQKLLGPALPLLDGVRHVFVVPDGALQSLPIGVLVTAPPPASGNDPRAVAWLARRHATTVLPSVSSLRALRAFAPAARPAETFVGIGDPTLDGRPGRVRGSAIGALYRGAVADVSVVRQIEPLPESADELRAIARALGAPPERLYMREAATERAVKTANLRARVIAFATHALVADELVGLAEPALVLTPPSVATPENDGLLTASEVAQLRLDADWVVLSACNTASGDGKPGAEGLSGLAKAFFYAGARALLVSHWPVVSEGAVKLTTGAFAALAREPGIGRAEAMRRAMLALLDDPSLPPDFAHPAIWAPFVVVGEGAPGR